MLKDGMNGKDWPTLKYLEDRVSEIYDMFIMSQKENEVDYDG